MIIIIPCGGKKREFACPAGNLYVGPYFKGCLGYALSFVEPNGIYILSAKHGLLALGDRIGPYDIRMGQQGCVDADTVRLQAEQRGILTTDVIALGGVEYLNVVRQVWPAVVTPMIGVGGIGKQLAWLKEHRQKRNPGQAGALANV